MTPILVEQALFCFVPLVMTGAAWRTDRRCSLPVNQS